MTKAEKFNLYADTLYGMCRKAQDTVPEANVCFECKAFSSEKSGTYRTICVGITTTEGKSTCIWKHTMSAQKGRFL